MDREIKTKLLKAIEGLQRDLSTLDSIHRNMIRLNKEITSLHDQANRNVEQFVESVSGGVNKKALAEALQKMQETQMSFSLQYLQLQSRMQNENRAYTAVSNIMKTKHDTVKNSISNIR